MYIRDIYSLCLKDRGSRFKLSVKVKKMSKTIVAIGALGGSGTRAVAKVFLEMGVFMGDKLNISKDNLLFTILFKNPIWYRTSSKEDKELRLRIFQKYMEGCELNLSESNELDKAISTNPTFKKRLNFNLKQTGYINEKTNIWGWKEPNTQIFVSEILNFFPQLKYIHILRHGIDMAFSNNNQQLNNWGWKYGIELSGNEDKNQIATKQLEYWVKSTKDVLAKIKVFNEKVLILNHSKFCTQPQQEIDRIIEFIGIPIKWEFKKKLYEIPKNKGTNNRYKDYDLTIFSQGNLQFVKECGFNIEINESRDDDM